METLKCVLIKTEDSMALFNSTEIVSTSRKTCIYNNQLIYQSAQLIYQLLKCKMKSENAEKTRENLQTPHTQHQRMRLNPESVRQQLL